MTAYEIVSLIIARISSIILIADHSPKYKYMKSQLFVYYMKSKRARLARQTWQVTGLMILL